MQGIDPKAAASRRKVGRNEPCPCGSGEKTSAAASTNRYRDPTRGLPSKAPTNSTPVPSSPPKPPSRSPATVSSAPVRVKGRSQAVKIGGTVWRAIGSAGDGDQELRRGACALAPARIYACGGMHRPDRRADRPATLFSERAEEVAKHPPGADWEPIRTLQERMWSQNPMPSISTICRPHQAPQPSQRAGTGSTNGT